MKLVEVLRRSDNRAALDDQSGIASIHPLQNDRIRAFLTRCRNNFKSAALYCHCIRYDRGGRFRADANHFLPISGSSLLVVSSVHYNSRAAVNIEQIVGTGYVDVGVFNREVGADRVEHSVPIGTGNSDIVYDNRCVFNVSRVLASCGRKQSAAIEFNRTANNPKRRAPISITGSNRAAVHRHSSTRKTLNATGNNRTCAWVAGILKGKCAVVVDGVVVSAAGGITIVGGGNRLSVQVEYNLLVRWNLDCGVKFRVCSHRDCRRLRAILRNRCNRVGKRRVRRIANLRDIWATNGKRIIS